MHKKILSLFLVLSLLLSSLPVMALAKPITDEGGLKVMASQDGKLMASGLNFKASKNKSVRQLRSSGSLESPLISILWDVEDELTRPEKIEFKVFSNIEPWTTISLGNLEVPNTEGQITIPLTVPEDDDFGDSLESVRIETNVPDSAFTFTIRPNSTETGQFSHYAIKFSQIPHTQVTVNWHTEKATVRPNNVKLSYKISEKTVEKEIPVEDENTIHFRSDKSGVSTDFDYSNELPLGKEKVLAAVAAGLGVSLSPLDKTKFLYTEAGDYKIGYQKDISDLPLFIDNIKKKFDDDNPMPEKVKEAVEAAEEIVKAANDSGKVSDKTAEEVEAAKQAIKNAINPVLQPVHPTQQNLIINNIDPTASKIEIKKGTDVVVVLTKDSDGKWKSPDANYLVTESDMINVTISLTDEAKNQLKNQLISATTTDASVDPEISKVSNTIKYDIEAPAKAIVDPITAGDKAIKVKTPAESDAKKVTVTLPDGTTVVAEKDSEGKWKVGDSEVEEKDGKLEIPVPSEKVTAEGEVKVTVSDESNNASEPTVRVVAKAPDTEAPAKAVVDPITAGDKAIKVKTPAESDAKKVTVTLPDDTTVVAEKDSDGKWKVGDSEVVEKDGKLEIPVPAEKVTAKGKVKVTVSDESNNASEPTEVTVDPPADPTADANAKPVKPVKPEEPFNPEDNDDPNNDGKTPDGYVRIIFDSGKGNFGQYKNTKVEIKKVAWDVKKDILWQTFKGKVPQDVNPPKGEIFSDWKPNLPKDSVSVKDGEKYFTAQYRKKRTSGREIDYTEKDKPELEKDLHYAYMFGYPDKSFGADQPITRAEVAALFTRLSVKSGEIDSGDARFSDVEAGSWYAKSVNYLAGKGILAGYKDGSFRPNNHITRAEFAAIASRYGDFKPGDKTFPDVAKDHWAVNAINAAAAADWIRGYEDGSFRPANDISRAEVVSIVNRMLNRHADLVFIKDHLNDLELNTFTDVMDESYWAYGEIMEATNGHDFERLADGKAERWIKLNGKRF